MNYWSALVSVVLIGTTAMAAVASPPTELPAAVVSPAPEVTSPPAPSNNGAIHIIVTRAPDPTPKRVELTEEEETILLKLGMAEAGAQSVECIASVMRTVLNRVESDDFPDDIPGVVFQRNQFTPVLYGSYYDAVPNERCYEALGFIKAGWDESRGSLYFETAVDYPTWHSENLKFLFRADDMMFYKE